jgi:hypothetical protein
VLLFVQLAIGVDICCHHPGDEFGWKNEESPADLKTRAPEFTHAAPAAAAPHHHGGADKGNSV